MRRQRQLTVSPREAVFDLGLKKSSLTDTEVVSLALPVRAAGGRRRHEQGGEQGYGQWRSHFFTAG